MKIVILLILILLSSCAKETQYYESISYTFTAIPEFDNTYRGMIEVLMDNYPFSKELAKDEEIIEWLAINIYIECYVEYSYSTIDSIKKHLNDLYSKRYSEIKRLKCHG